MRNFQRLSLSKILRAIAFLFEEATTRPVTGIEIMQAIGEVDPDASSLNDSELKMFQRLKKDIRELGIPLESPQSEGRMQEEGASAYRIPRREYALKRLTLSAGEEAVLAILANFISQDEGFPLRSNLAMALEKVSQVSQHTLTSPPSQGPLFPSPDELQPKQDPDVLNELILANAKNEPIRFQYQGVQADQPTMRKVEPYGLFTRRQLWYLVGRDVQKDEVRVFRVSRIQDPAKIEVCRNENFRIPSDFRLRTYASVPPWNFFSSAAETKVRIEFSKDEFWRVEHFCRMHGEVCENDGSTVVAWCPSVKEFDPLIKWLLPFGAAAKPIDPPEFKLRYKQVVTESLDRYARAAN